MDTGHGYVPRQSRTVSLGGAFLINGAIIAGLIYSAPDFIKKVGPNVLPLTEYKDPIVPPPLDEPKPKTDNRVERQAPKPNAPKPIIETNTTNTTATTDIIYPPVLPLDQPPVKEGPPATYDPPKPVLLFVGASTDPRFAGDFQPVYPPKEINAQRSGVVQVKVLIGIDGRVKAVEQLSATSAAFFDTTKRQALSKWRFRPATRGGVPEESWKTLTVRFELENR